MEIVDIETYSGSPPHTWRIRRVGDNNFGLQGITSTYVENTT